MSGYFYKNADADEMIFIHEGSGVLKTMYGNIEFGYGDYLVIQGGRSTRSASATVIIVSSSSNLSVPSAIRKNT